MEDKTKCLSYLRRDFLKTERYGNKKKDFFYFCISGVECFSF